MHDLVGDVVERMLAEVVVALAVEEFGGNTSPPPQTDDPTPSRQAPKNGELEDDRFVVRVLAVSKVLSNVGSSFWEDDLGALTLLCCVNFLLPDGDFKEVGGDSMGPLTRSDAGAAVFDDCGWRRSKIWPSSSFKPRENREDEQEDLVGASLLLELSSLDDEGPVLMVLTLLLEFLRSQERGA